MRHAMLIALAASAAVSAPAFGLEPTISEQLLSPLGQGFTYTPSPAPVDLVTVGPAGSRMAVYRNGEPGPKFDEIVTTQPTPEGGGGIAVVFSPDGSRYAYVGRKRDEFTLIVDGEETLTGKYGQGYNTIAGIGFTADNKLFYRIRQEDEDGKAPWHFVMDSKASPPLAQDQFQVLRSPAGSGYALVARLFGTNEPVFVRDGEIAESAATNFVYAPDGRLFTLEYDPDTSDSILRRDGEELFRGDYMVQDIVPAPAGESWAIVGTSRSKGTNAHIVLNGEEIEGSVSNMVGNQRVWFSDDGQHWAAIMKPQTGREYVVVDGKEEDEYRSIHEFAFSPDGNHHAYWGRSPTGAYLVIDGEEQDGVSTNTAKPVWGGNGDHVAWAEIGGNPARFSVLHDGDRHVGTHQLHHLSLGFSPDGNRAAFMDTGTVAEFTPEGVKPYTTARVIPPRFDNRPGVIALPLGYLFSPDSALLAFHGTDTQTGKQGFFLNGQFAFEAPGVAVLRIGFSPDSKHLYVLMGVTGAERLLYVDGEPAMRLGPQPFEQVESMWHVNDDGTLSFMIADNEGIKRITVTPSPDRTTADLVSD